MRKIINAYSFVPEPVQITVNAPPPAVITSDTDEPEQELSEEEKAALLKVRKEEEERKRIEALAEERVNEIIAAHREAVNNESEAIIAKAKAEAARIEEKSRAAAAETLRYAGEEAEALKKKYREEGYKDGFDAGREDAAKKCQGYLDAAGQFLEEINAHKEAYYISNEAEFRDTVVFATEKIVLEKIRKSDKIVEKIIAQAAKSFRNSDFVKISVLEGSVSKQFRTDMAYVSAIAENIPDVEVEILPPEEYPEGTVILDNGSEIIDASVPTQIEFLKEIVNGSAPKAE